MHVLKVPIYRSSGKLCSHSPTRCTCMFAECEGEEDEMEGWVVSSESCSFQAIGARYYREVLPGT